MIDTHRRERLEYKVDGAQERECTGKHEDFRERAADLLSTGNDYLFFREISADVMNRVQLGQCH